MMVALKQNMRSLLALAAVTLIVGCMGVKSSRRLRPEVLAPPAAWSGVARIAVLPPDNWTLDAGLEYITWYRAVIHELLRERGYEVAPLADVNRFFRQNKFAVAGEVGQYTQGELAKRFGVDAILYWAITEKSPRLMFSLEKADGTVLWGTGEVALRLSHVAPVSGHYAQDDRGIALELGEVLRQLPARVP
jgi:hypothetical protein